MIRVIPAIDVIDGKCVRLAYGDFTKKVIYDEKPWEVARRFEEAGVKRLHLVDLDGAKQGKVVNFRVLERIATVTNLIVDFGGGIKTDEDIKIAFNSGAQMKSAGSIVVKDKPLFKNWLKIYGAEKIIAAADVRDEKVAISGWQEDSGIWIYDFINELLEEGTKQVICTDISKDGSLAGPATQLYKSILEKIKNFNLIASGGISCLKDIEEVEQVGCKEVIVGKALYEGKIQLNELKPFLN